jgi:hypothetical protein
VDTVTQTDALLAELRYRGSRGLTPLEALDAIGTMRLAARVYDLRQRGVVINEEIVVRGGRRYARYWLDTEPQQLMAWGDG